MTNEELSLKLRAARPSLNFPADFQRGIWGRIASSEAMASERIFIRFLGWLARPLPAMALLICMGGVGCVVGAVMLRGGASAAAEQGYVKSVSPFAAANLSLRK